MKYIEVLKLEKEVKRQIVIANHHGKLNRVRELKIKRKLLRQKLADFRALPKSERK